MMTKQGLAMLWDHLRQANGITMRLVADLPADKLDARPIANMRTPKELLVHAYGMSLRAVAEGMLSGEIKDFDETSAVAAIRTKDDLIRFCTECWRSADRAMQSVDDTQLAAAVKSPWGMDFPGHVCFTLINDELFHHRGQLFTYLRAFGQDVPMMWDFEHNDPEFQPRAHAAV
jgi:uncharacterized damage-inducible protein DinB